MTEKKRNKKEVTVSDPNNLEREYADTFSLGYNDVEFQLNFGEFVKEDTIEVISKIKFPPTLVKHLIFGLLSAAEHYGEEYNTDLGFLKDIETIEK